MNDTAYGCSFLFCIQIIQLNISDLICQLESSIENLPLSTNGNLRKSNDVTSVDKMDLALLPYSLVKTIKILTGKSGLRKFNQSNPQRSFDSQNIEFDIKKLLKNKSDTQLGLRQKPFNCKNKHKNFRRKMPSRSLIQKNITQNGWGWVNIQQRTLPRWK